MVLPLTVPVVIAVGDPSVKTTLKLIELPLMVPESGPELTGPLPGAGTVVWVPEMELPDCTRSSVIESDSPACPLHRPVTSVDAADEPLSTPVANESPPVLVVDEVSEDPPPPPPPAAAAPPATATPPAADQ